MKDEAASLEPCYPNYWRSDGDVGSLLQPPAPPSRLQQLALVAWQICKASLRFRFGILRQRLGRVGAELCLVVVSTPVVQAHSGRRI